MISAVIVPAKAAVQNIVVPAKVCVKYEVVGGEPYTGPTEFTPTQEVQYAMTGGKVMVDNIRINPIPSNYGLITYNGSVITVS